MADREVVRAACRPRYFQNHALTRKLILPTIPSSGKITQVLHNDFLSFSPAVEGHSTRMGARQVFNCHEQGGLHDAHARLHVGRVQDVQQREGSGRGWHVSLLAH